MIQGVGRQEKLELGAKFLSEARRELEEYWKTAEDVNLREACEKGWEAMAQLLMYATGREITEHRGFSKAATDLYKKIGRKEIVLTETAAEALHAAGFYHGVLTADAVELTLISIEEIFRILQGSK